MMSLPKIRDYSNLVVAHLAKNGKTYSKQQVYNVVTGKYFNLDVAEAFISVVEDNRKRAKELEERIVKLKEDETDSK